MSGNETPGEGGIRKKPSYSEVLKSTPSSRPTPINTDVARAMQGGAKATSATTSSAFWSATNTSLGTGLTAATPLFSPSIWSPVHYGTQSATIPHKLSWDIGVNDGVKSKTPAKQAQSPSPAVGLGLNLVNANSVAPPQSNIPANGTPYKFKQHDIPTSQCRPFSRDGGVSLAHTAPLLQQPFHGSRDDTSRNYASGQPTALDGVEATHNNATAKVSTVDGNASQTSTSSLPLFQIRFAAGEPGTLSIKSFDIGNPDASPSEWSALSDISEHIELDRIGLKPDSVAEKAHPENFARTRLDDSIQFAEAFPGAEAICSGINPSHYGMEYGSRVICIKTDFVENIHWSLKTGNWIVMDKVAARIMQLYDNLESVKAKVAKAEATQEKVAEEDATKDDPTKGEGPKDKHTTDKGTKDKESKKMEADDKVLFVFSINGQKSYCGLAEMSGPWKPAGENIEGFRIKKDGNSRTWGIMPLTWLYVKNVPYYWFRDIKNPYNDQDIVNMWNGMHFPCEVAREVVELIVRRPHFTNVMCWRLDRSYDPYRPVLDAFQLDPTAGDGKRITNPGRMLEYGRPTGHGHGRGPNGGPAGQSTRGNAFSVANWRQPQEHPQQTGGPNVGGSNAAPTFRQGGTKHIAASATPPNLDGHTSPGPLPGQLVACRLDDSGNYVPVTPGGGMANSPMASDTNSLMSHTPRRPTPARGTGFTHRGNGRGGYQAARGNLTGVNTPGGGGSTHLGNACGGHQATRGNLSGFNNDGVNTPGGGVRIAPTSLAVPGQHSSAGLVKPQLHHMTSNMGFEDPFASPRQLVQANAMANMTHRAANAQTMPGSQTATFHRAVSNANFVPQHVTAQVAFATAPHNYATANAYTPAHSGGVALGVPTPYRSPGITLARTPDRRQVKLEIPKNGGTTPAGYQIYPTPTDPMHVPRDAVVSPTPTNSTREVKNAMRTTDVERLQMEYLEHLSREATIKREMAAIRLQKAGGALLGQMTEASKSGRKEE